MLIFPSIDTADILLNILATPLRTRILVQVTIYRSLLTGRDDMSTNQKPTIYRNLYENTDPDSLYMVSNLSFIRSLLLVDCDEVEI